MKSRESLIMTIDESDPFGAAPFTPLNLRFVIDVNVFRNVFSIRYNYKYFMVFSIVEA